MLERQGLIKRLQSGQYEALEEAYDLYKDHLLTVAVCLVRDRSLAEDCLHDVFVRLAATPDRFKIQTSLKAYLSVAVANRCRDRLRQRKGCDLSGDDWQEREYEPPPEQDIMARDRSSRIVTALGQLPYAQREVVMLRFFSGMRFRQIAKSQQVSTHCVRSRCRYALSKLRLLLKDEVS